MFDLDSFISNELTIAPKHPLAANLELPIPDIQASARQEIQDIQRRDRIPGVVKRLISIDAETAWEYWWCVPGRILLPEDVELLHQDRPRVEAILGKLLWLFGGHCFGETTERLGDQGLVYDWQQVVEFARQHGYDSYVLDVDFLPTTIVSAPIETSAEGNSHHALVEPAHWHIEFFQLDVVEGGFELREPKKLCSCQIWIGQPFLKDLKTGVATIRYDLYVSVPRPLTTPPWLQ